MDEEGQTHEKTYVCWVRGNSWEVKGVEMA